MWDTLRSHAIPFVVTVLVKSRDVTVKGPRGTLRKSFKHMDLEITRVGKRKLRVDMWFASKKKGACLRTICSHIENMFNGVLCVSVVLCTESRLFAIVDLTFSSNTVKLFNENN